MGYLSREQAEQLGFKFIGKNVKISDKCSIYEPENISIGDNSRIDDFSVISGKVTLGRNVHITPQCLLAGGEKGILMEDFSALAYGVKVFTQSDDYSGSYMTNPTLPRIYTKVTKRQVCIGRHSIVGTNSVILPGSILKNGVSVGAVSLVQGLLREWSIYSGNPAIFIRERKRDLLFLENKYLASVDNY